MLFQFCFVTLFGAAFPLMGYGNSQMSAYSGFMFFLLGFVTLLVTAFPLMGYRKL
jgi:hypothetical protein